LARANDRAQIIARIHRVRRDSTGRFGRLSAPEMIVHCTDSLKCGLGLRAVSSVETAFGRTIMKFAALYVPLRWPPGVPTRPEMDPQRGGTRPSAFAADVACLIATVEQFGVRHQDTPWTSRHPFFGAMTEWQWQRWAYLHTDHHLRQFGA
jgi:hypothetical protein